ncbi:hypothetical protein H6768_03880 [Candidatus Peribacteria bacterium]|nr:hypothetical protein [Candidatus Peribacteria bacterium]
MSPNIRRHSHEFEPKYTPRRRRSVSSKVRSLFLRWGLPVIAGTTLIATADVPGRVARALQDRPEFLRETIRSYSDNNRFLEYQTRNHAYYISKGIVDADDNQKLTDSLTRLDILVQAFQEGTLTENDFLQHIFGTHERIVSEPGTYMDITVHNEDKTRRVQYS